MRIKITIEGPRGCGKTWTLNLIEAVLRQHFRHIDWTAIDDGTIKQSGNRPPIEWRELEAKL